jgi:NADP-dependent 3-hydroxy acid dehydrogenase YdfG
VPHADLDALDDATIDRVLATNVRGAFALVRAFAPPLLRSSGDAVAITVSSIAASTGSVTHLRLATGTVITVDGGKHALAAPDRLAARSQAVRRSEACSAAEHRRGVEDLLGQPELLHQLGDPLEQRWV